MILTHPLVLAIGVLSTLISANAPYTGPLTPTQFRKHHLYHHLTPNHKPKTYIRASHNDTDDTSADFLQGLKKANHGRVLMLESVKTYVIGKKLDLTFLKDVEVQLDGEIKFRDNNTYWQNNYFYHPFQKSITFWKWGGENIKVFENGTLNGNGQAWYDRFAGFEILDRSNDYLRPILFYAENATNLRIESITFTGSPCRTNFVVTSKNAVYDNVIIDNFSTNENLPKNTNGWDSYNVDQLTVRNDWVNIGDDCFSPKPNTSNIMVENTYCNETRGINMSSIGQYEGVKTYISNAYIGNVTTLNAQRYVSDRTEQNSKAGQVQMWDMNIFRTSLSRTSTILIRIGRLFLMHVTST